MKQLTFYMRGTATFTSDVSDQEADHVIQLWRQAQARSPHGPATLRIDGDPVMEIGLHHVDGITTTEAPDRSGRK